MRVKAGFLGTLVWSYLFCVLCTSPVAAEDVGRAVSYALEHHPAVEGAHLGYKAAQRDQKVEQSNFYPELSAGITAGRVYQDNATSRGLSVTRGAAYSGLGEGNIALTQTVFDGMETQNRVKAAEARAKSSHYGLLGVQGTIALRVAQSYTDILRLYTALNILKQQAESIKDYEARIEDMVVQGVADEAELQQAKDVAMIVDGLRVEYRAQLLSGKAAYVEAVGIDFREMFPKRAQVPDSLSSFIPEDIFEGIKDAKERHPLLQAADMDSAASGHDVKVERAALYPDVRGELSYLKTDKRDIIGGETKDARATLRMNWNFSTGLGAMHAVQKKRYEHYEASANREAMEAEIERDIHQAYAHYNMMKEKNVLSRNRVELNEKLLEAYKTQFEGARISFLSVMRAESQLFNARLEENDNKYNLLSAEYALLGSLGQLKDILISQLAETEVSPEGEQKH